MSQNYLQPGDHITIAAAPAAVQSGDGVVIGDLFGVASGDAEAGAEVVVVTTGVFSLPKLVTDSFAVGEPVYFSVGACTSTATGNKRIGVAVKAAGASASTVVEVRLSGDW